MTIGPLVKWKWQAGVEWCIGSLHLPIRVNQLLPAALHREQACHESHRGPNFDDRKHAFRRHGVTLNGEEPGAEVGDSQIGLRRALVSAEEAAEKGPSDVEDITRADFAGATASSSGTSQERSASCHLHPEVCRLHNRPAFATRVCLVPCGGQQSTA